MRRFVIMGVAGCGKTSIGEIIATEGLLSFVDGDALHPATNIEKMSSGTPLDDDDRRPWLKRVGQELGGASEPIAIGCSALKRWYRDLIRESAEGDVGFVHLAAPMDVIAKRMVAREGHFMPTSLLKSQYHDLEPLEYDESGRVIDISVSADEVAASVRTFIKETIS